ncbi:esterase family protein [candidate division KSB1 bacterium]|nr:esterase family protein [candidate division KSB1 bacterium]
MLIYRKSILIILIIILFSITVSAQVSRGTVQEGLIIHSEILKKDVRYTIYLPFDYETSNRFYPVVYLLHGYTDNDMGWIQFGEANLIADEAIAHREIPSMIIAMPDGGVSWYINNFDGSVKYEDFFIKEFIPFIESKYRIRAEKRYRGVAGLSMGGYGSLIYALKHPDLFAGCVAFSAAIYTTDDVINVTPERWQRTESLLYGPNLKGKDRLTKHWQSNNPISIVQNSDVELIKKVRLYIDCGDDDFLYRGNSNFHILLRELNIPHEYRVRDGAHSWGYWRTGLADGLKFLGTSFHQP